MAAGGSHGDAAGATSNGRSVRETGAGVPTSAGCNSQSATPTPVGQGTGVLGPEPAAGAPAVASVDPARRGSRWRSTHQPHGTKIHRNRAVTATVRESG